MDNPADEWIKALPVLVLCRDLMLASRISTASRASGIAIKVLRDPAKLATEPGTKLLVDLNQDHAMEAASAWRTTAGRVVVGFVSHVDTDTISRAEQSGIDQVLPRSRFVAQVENILKG